MKNAKSAQTAANDIDLTPMLDVVFIMLIFFIVTASFLNEKALLLNSNPKQTTTTSEHIPLVIQVSSTNEITVDNRRVEPSALRAIIAQRHAENAELAVIVNAHALAKADTYVAIANAAKQAKVGNVSLKTHE